LPGGTVTTQSPSLEVATPLPFELADEELDVAPPDAEAGPLDDVTPPGPAVTELDMPPASDRPETPAFGFSTTRQGLPSGPVAVVRPSGPVEVETEPPDPELEEDELDAAMAPVAPSVSAPRAKAVRAILDRDMRSPSKAESAAPRGRA